MAIKIDSVSVTPQTVNVGQTVTIKITARDVTWGVIKTDFTNWNAIKTNFADWKAVMNYK